MEQFHEAILNSEKIYHSVEIAKNTKGYNWTIKCAGTDKEKVVQTAKDIEKDLKKEYGE